MELADILKLYLPKYLGRHNISPWQRKILFDIQVCRTSACGAHLEVCDHCRHEQPAYNSCHNRHCPKCFGIARKRWVAARLQEILPVPYYHVVFTLPHRLNTLAIYNKHLLYTMFYRAAAYTLLRFGKDSKYLGGQLGFVAVLHTWGKGLCHHIHWHFIVAGCGLTRDGKLVQLPYADKYLFPVQAMSKVIRARFIRLLRRAYNDGKLIVPDKESPLADAAMFEYFLNDVASDNWVNYAKRPFGGPEQVVKYIGRYTHRVALRNSRLLDISNGRIRFQVKDYKSGGQKEEMTLASDEFIRRFLLHILPKRFRKIRYGGFMAQPVREEKLALLRSQFNVPQAAQRLEASLEIDHSPADASEKCPICQIGSMRPVGFATQHSDARQIVYQDSS